MLTYGQSITDACMDFESTVSVLETLAAAVRARRAR
jgi:3-deoxy-7-phosphoheptulonate synthase